MVLTDAIFGFLRHLQFEKRLSQHTLIAYKNDLLTFTEYIQYAFEVVNCNEIKTPFIRTWMAQLREEGITPRSINRKLSALRSLYKFMMKQGWVSVSPLTSINSPKSGKRLPVYIEENQLSQLWQTGIFQDDWEGKTAQLAIRLLYETGLRRSELISLTETHTDLYQQTIRVLGKGNKERILPLRKDLLALVTTYLEDKKNVENADRQYVLVQPNGKPVAGHWVYKTVKKYLALVTTQDKKSPHILRHSFATHLTNAGADLNAVKELLGHSSLAATQVYTHNSIEKLKKVHEQAHPRGGKNL